MRKTDEINLIPKPFMVQCNNYFQRVVILDFGIDEDLVNEPAKAIVRACTWGHLQKTDTQLP